MSNIIDPLDGHTPRWRPSESPLYDQLVAEVLLRRAEAEPLAGLVVNR